MITDIKLVNEVKIKTAHVNRTDPEYRVLEEVVQKLFRKVEFDESKDWNISFGIKNDMETGLRQFTGCIKMIDKNITGHQLAIFTEFKNEFEIVAD